MVAGAYAADLLLKVSPTCATGSCAVAAKLIDPHSGRTLATKTVRPSAEGYRVKIAATVTDLCRGRAGLTVKDGAKRTTSLVLRPFVSPDGGRRTLAIEGSGRVNPTKRGDGAGCRDAKAPAKVTAEKLTREQLASVKGRLSPIPLPDLVPLPRFTVSIKGVRSIYYGVKGDRSSVLIDRWAATSSRAKYCGRIDYSWYSGSGQTSSCIKAESSVHYSNAYDDWSGSCTITSVSARWSFSMPIARWSGPSLVPRLLIPWWKATLRYVRDHEARHVAIYSKWTKVLPGRVVGHSCASANSIVSKWMRQVNAAQEAFDKKDCARNDWPVPPYQFR